MAEGLNRRDATIKAMSEVAGPIVAITAVLSCVFIPTAFIPGLTGSFYRQFALTIAFSTILSMVNSLTLSPAMCALFLQPPEARKDFLGRMLDGLLGWFFRLFNRTFEGTQELYTSDMLKRLIRWSLHRSRCSTRDFWSYRVYVPKGSHGLYTGDRPGGHIR